MCFGGLTPFVGRSSLLGGILELRRAKGVLASFCGQIRRAKRVVELGLSHRVGRDRAFCGQIRSFSEF